MALDRCAVSAIKLDEAHDLLAKLDGPLPSEPQSDSPITSHYQDPAEKIYGTKFEINEKWTGTISEFCEKNLSKSFAIGGLTCKDTEVKFDKSYGSYSVKPCGEALQSKYVMWKAIFCGDR